MPETRSDNTPVRPDFSLPPTELPRQTRVVIVGGGIVGASIAYHFAEAGWRDVVLLEQNKIGSGTTWHSAGQVGQLRSSAAQTKVNRASAELFARLEVATGHDPGWVPCGGMQLASCPERLLQLQRNVAMAQVFGVEADLISPRECGERWPGLRTDDLVGGVYLPGDGRVMPGECTVALIKGAMDQGVSVMEGVRVERLVYHENARGQKQFQGVSTNRGSIECEWVVLASNMWMRTLGLTAGVPIPVYPCEHHYVITEPMPGIDRNCPCTRDPDAGLYFRALDDGGLKLGAFKKRSKPWQIGDHVPEDFAFRLLEPDWPDFAEPFAAHQHRLPGLEQENVVKFVNGPEAFTPDNQFILGEPYLTKGLFVAGGWNSAGIASAGGAGKYAVEWMDAGGMTLDLTSVDILRFSPWQNQRPYLQERVSEVLGLHYQMAWPGREMETARDKQRLPLHDRYVAANACFGETSGWERPLFFAPSGTLPQIDYSFRRQNWHDIVQTEVAACRQRLSLLDQSTFGKIEVSGRDVLPLLQFLCGRNVDIPVGTATYTGMFNATGTYEADVTVLRTDSERFTLVTATRQRQKDLDWLTRHSGLHEVDLRDVTEAWSVLSVMGPQSIEFLAKCLPEHFDNAPGAYGEIRLIKMAGAEARAVRMSYVGEQGWEFHVSATQASRWYDWFKKQGKRWGLQPIGNYAVSAMRIESGMRAFGHELSPAENPWQAGLSWTLDWEFPFLGSEKLAKLREAPRAKRLLCFALHNEDAILWGGEPIYWGDQAVGHTTSGCFGPTLGRSVAMGYVNHPEGHAITSKDIADAEWSVEQWGTRWPTRASLKSFLGR